MYASSAKWYLATRRLDFTHPVVEVIIGLGDLR